MSLRLPRYTFAQRGIEMSSKVPPFVTDFRTSHPDIWKSFNDLASQCHDAGPLDEKSRRLVKLALCIGAGLEGGAHSAARNAKTNGVTFEEAEHIAVLAITTLGFPAAMRALTWISDCYLGDGARGAGAGSDRS